jgi:hypothetical protein
MGFQWAESYRSEVDGFYIAIALNESNTAQDIIALPKFVE